MSTLRGIAGGVLGLSLLEVLVSKRQAADNAGTLIDVAAAAFKHLVDPKTPLIPDRRDHTPAKQHEAN